jgi:hypothetical protein
MHMHGDNEKSYVFCDANIKDSHCSLSKCFTRFYLPLPVGFIALTREVVSQARRDAYVGAFFVDSVTNIMQSVKVYMMHKSNLP